MIREPLFLLNMQDFVMQELQIGDCDKKSVKV